MTVALREVALMLLCASRDLPVLGDQNKLELATVANRKTILRHASSSSGGGQDHASSAALPHPPFVQ